MLCRKKARLIGRCRPSHAASRQAEVGQELDAPRNAAVSRPHRLAAEQDGAGVAGAGQPAAGELDQVGVVVRPAPRRTARSARARRAAARSGAAERSGRCPAPRRRPDSWRGSLLESIGVANHTRAHAGGRCGIRGSIGLASSGADARRVARRAAVSRILAARLAAFASDPFLAPRRARRVRGQIGWYVVSIAMVIPPSSLDLGCGSQHRQHGQGNRASDRRSVTGAASVEPLDLHRGHVGGLGEDRLLDGLLHRHGRRRAAVAASLQPQPHDAVVARRAARRCRRASGGRAAPARGPGARAPPGPAGAARGAGAGRPPRRRGRRRRGPRGRPRPAAVQVVEEPLQAGAVQVEDGLHDLAGLGLRRGVGEVARPPAAGRRAAASRAWNSRASSVSATSISLLSGAARSRAAGTSVAARRTSARAGRRAACRCPGTCGRRRAGTGRSCAPRA